MLILFQGVKYFSLERLHEYFGVISKACKNICTQRMHIGACRALSDVLAAMECVQPDISFLGEIFLKAAPSHSNFSRYGYLLLGST